MADFTVSKVIDGDTFEVQGGWKWGDKKGSRVRPANLNAPELKAYGGAAAKQRLKKLIEGKVVQLKNAVNMSYGRIVCDVFINGKNIIKQL